MEIGIDNFVSEVTDSRTGVAYSSAERMSQPAPRPPLPVPQPETDFYWEKTHAHELWLMRCDDCGSTYFYPRPICPRCSNRRPSDCSICVSM